MGAISLAEAAKYTHVKDDTLPQWGCFFCGSANQGHSWQYTPALNTPAGLFNEPYTRHDCCLNCRAKFYNVNIMQRGKAFGHDIRGIMTVAEKLKYVGLRILTRENVVIAKRNPENYVLFTDVYIPRDFVIIEDELGKPNGISNEREKFVTWAEVLGCQFIPAMVHMQLKPDLIYHACGLMNMSKDAMNAFLIASDLILPDTGW